MNGCRHGGPWRVRKVLVALFGLVAWVLAGPSPAAAGSIKGTVRLSGSVPTPKKLAVTVDQFVCGKEKDARGLVLSPQGGIRDAVVWLDLPPAPATPAGSAVVQIDQQQCVFVPRVVVVPAGGTVEFLNSDPLLHNIKSRSVQNVRFNHTHPKGRTIPLSFAKPEIVRVGCDLHPWMRAWVVVAAHPFYAVTNDRGEFVLLDVPRGTYTLRVWQERLESTTAEVRVKDHGVATVTVEMRPK
jgi:plastocyanin